MIRILHVDSEMDTFCVCPTEYRLTIILTKCEMIAAAAAESHKNQKENYIVAFEDKSKAIEL